MPSVEEAYKKWLHYAGYNRPKLSFEAYHKVVNRLSKSQLQELLSKIHAKQQKQERIIARAYRKKLGK